MCTTRCTHTEPRQHRTLSCALHERPPEQCQAVASALQPGRRRQDTPTHAEDRLSLELPRQSVILPRFAPADERPLTARGVHIELGDQRGSVYTTKQCYI